MEKLKECVGLKKKEAVLEAFAKHMKNLTLPSLREIQEMKKKYTLLIHRTSPQIKTWFHNKQKTLKRICKYIIFVNFILHTVKNLSNKNTYKYI